MPSRSHLTTHLTNYLLAPSGRHLKLAGQPGIGVSTAARLAVSEREVRLRYPDGIVSLAWNTPVTWEPLLHQVRRVPGHATACHPSAALEWLATSASVIVVDTRVAGAAGVEQLLTCAPEGRSRIVVLSDDLVPTDDVDNVVVEPLSSDSERSEGAQLAQRRASGLAISLTGHDAVRLSRRCHGLPLAINLSVGAIPDVGLEHTLEALGEGDDPVATALYLAERVAGERLERLSDIAVGPTFLPSDVVAAAFGDDRSAPRELALRGWLEPVDTQGWRLPSAVRRHLTSRLGRRPGGLGSAWDRLEAAVHASLAPSDPRPHSDVHHLDHALASALWQQRINDGRTDSLVEHRRRWRVWARSTHAVADLRCWLLAVQQQHSEHPTVGLHDSARDAKGTQVTLLIADCDTDLHRADQAERTLRDLLTALGPDDPLLPYAHASLAAALFSLERFAAAAEADEDAVRSAMRLGIDERTIATFLANEAQARLMAGEVDGAELPLRRAIEQRRAAGDEHTLLLEESALGLLLVALGRQAEAVSLLGAALRRAEHLKARHAMPYVAHSLAFAHLVDGRPAEAHAAALMAADAATPTMHADVHIILDVTFARISIASLHNRLDPSDAREPIIAGLRDPHAAWYAAIALAELLSDVRGNPEDAQRLWRLLATAPLEAHLAYIVRNRTTLEPDASAPRADREALERLLDQIEPGLLSHTPQRRAAGATR